MGREKNDQMEREEAWGRLANAKGHKCAVCSCTIPYGEQEVFFETGMCGSCANAATKDD
jgi:hypothetical protein